VQGDFRVKIAEILQDMGFKVKRINFWYYFISISNEVSIFAVEWMNE
jgi:hypothetical protein